MIGFLRYAGGGDLHRPGRLARGEPLLPWPPWLEQGAPILGLDDSVRALRSRMGLDQVPVRWVASGADSPELIQSLERIYGAGDQLRLVAVDDDGLPLLDAWDAALDGPGPRAVALLGIPSPAGLYPDAAPLMKRLAAADAELIVDCTRAAPGPFPGLEPHRPIGVIAGLDRWHAQPSDSWGSTVLSSLPGWDANPTLARLDADLRAALSGRPGVRLWPFGSCRRRVVGLVTLCLTDWGAEEAAALLEESLGIEVEAGGIFAVPPPDQFASRLLRLSWAPSTDEEVLATAAAGMLRMGAMTPPSLEPH